MKDVFASKAQEEFYEYMKNFAESLKSTFPECNATKDWCLWYDNVLMGDQENMRTCVHKWIDAMEEPLIKTKYNKAVQSITGGPPKVYHAIAYKDIDNADRSSAYLRDLQLPGKLSDARMDENSISIFWEYFHALNDKAYAAARKKPPRVPTNAEITADILKRKGGGGGSLPQVPSGPVLKAGVGELWKKLCQMRGVDPPGGIQVEQLTKTLYDMGKQSVDGESLADACKARKESAYLVILSTFPYLKTSSPFVEEEWCLVDKGLAMSTMEGAIPAPMMRGIENMASKLVKDISEGKADLSSLNMETIGQQVLSGVTSDDMSSFANNLDKIIPAMQRMQP